MGNNLNNKEAKSKWNSKRFDPLKIYRINQDTKSININNMNIHYKSLWLIDINLRTENIKRKILLKMRTLLIRRNLIIYMRDIVVGTLK